MAFAEDRLLLTNRRGQTWYFLPGGNVEPDETVDTALRRETALRGDRSPGPERRVPSRTSLGDSWRVNGYGRCVVEGSLAGGAGAGPDGEQGLEGAE
ncbi:NUDIX domain-containing protein, partial [Parafrankia sp. Ea1.12]|uniref:NUDIX domain-containing protein n=1 Tax=Parafrankia sp. Ea1.12 TaxID=573499 RepID=UPI0034CF4DAC